MGTRSSVARMTLQARGRTIAPLKTKDFLSILDVEAAELVGLLNLAAELKRDRALGRASVQPLAGRHVALLFEKPSLRTRSTFMIAIRELGGEVIETPASVALGDRETVEDVARSLERWVAGAVVRTFGQDRLRRFAAAAQTLRVVNALTDEEHPCQALADLLTLRERTGSLGGRTLTFLGGGNNVAASLAQAGAMLGVHVRIATPPDFALPETVLVSAPAPASQGGTVTTFVDPVAAVQGADAVYTDVWASMGEEAEASARDTLFRPYQVNDALMEAAGPQALFMHCLPAHR